MKLFSKIFGDNEREVRKYMPVVERVNALEPAFEALSDDELRAKTDEFRQRLADGEHIDDLLPEAFAAVREAAKRRVGQRPYDVQVVGAVVLHQGKIAELKTGEGKTLTATLPLYLNALEGKGAHLVTVNDYLAKRDAQWYGPVFDALGLSVGVLQHEEAFLFSPEKQSDTQNMEYLKPCGRREAYYADITYGTNHEFGFDYLRDNMAVSLEATVQRELHYAIVDEVDNILIDEARTPLIISGPAEDSAAMYQRFAVMAPNLVVERDYTIDEKARAVLLTEEGIERLEKLLNINNIYAPENYRLTRYMEAALKAHAIYKRDVDYVVKDGEIVIVDDFTGRLMFGRRWSDGLHQAVEAKERVKIQNESITYATITLQNYFRLYDKLAGMTGTAATEGEEFFKIYKLEVVVIPTNQPMVRDDFNDLVYRSERAKFEAVADEITELQQQGRPVLVGTVSIEKSEYLSELLQRRGIEHQVLNAKQHEREASIVAQAGRYGGVTIATNMAGRGTDIVLGGKPEGRTQEEWQEEHNRVVDAGGLEIIGTERHESRRIDNQLRGRSGRQGDPGSSRFYVSFEDDIMRRFAPDWLPGMMARLGMEEDMPIESGWVSRAIETAQTKVEGHNFDIRKHVVDYDDVMNTQRDVIYKERRKILEGADLKSNLLDMVHEELTAIVSANLPSDDASEGDLETMLTEVHAVVRLSDEFTPDALAGMTPDAILEAIIQFTDDAYEDKEEDLGHDIMRALERLVMLRSIDSLWVEHLTAMDEMRQGITLQAYGQSDPLVAYKREAHDMWDQLMVNIRNQITRAIYHVELVAPPQPAPPPVMIASQPGVADDGNGAAPAPAASPNLATDERAQRAVAAAAGVKAPPKNLRTNQPVEGGAGTTVRVAQKVGRNEPCPCGSGKKYKKCHGAE
ncbi:MAG: preprotein translocase subunit SecA [Dehalococcoidia bacterium]|nr:MAG: preprotein translocase subunit SecA [Dehalococcoidia bacterium]